PDQPGPECPWRPRPPGFRVLGKLADAGAVRPAGRPGRSGLVAGHLTDAVGRRQDGHVAGQDRVLALADRGHVALAEDLVGVVLIHEVHVLGIPEAALETLLDDRQDL